MIKLSLILILSGAVRLSAPVEYQVVKEPAEWVGYTNHQLYYKGDWVFTLTNKAPVHDTIVINEFKAMNK